MEELCIGAEEESAQNCAAAQRSCAVAGNLEAHHESSLERE